MQWPPRYAALKKSRVERGLYQCMGCKGIFRAKDVQVDHIEPVIEIEKGFVDYNTYISRLFCEVENFQALCSHCHKDKTSSEKEVADVAKRSKRR